MILFPEREKTFGGAAKNPFVHPARVHNQLKNIFLLCTVRDWMSNVFLDFIVFNKVKNFCFYFLYAKTDLMAEKKCLQPVFFGLL